MSVDEVRKPRSFAILGAGAAGKATAAYLALAGHHVRIYSHRHISIEDIANSGTITVQGLINDRTGIELATTEMPLAMETAEVLVITVPSHIHGDIARACARYLRDGQVVLLMPGRVFGALAFRNSCLEHGLNADVVIAETQTIPFTCRLTEAGAVELLAVKDCVKIATLPATGLDRVMGALSSVLPMLERAEDVLETGLNSVGGILHPLPTLMNLGWIETDRTDFKHYYEGISPSVAGILEQLDGERIAVGESLDVPMSSVTDWLKNTYAASGATLYQAIRNTSCYETIDAPTSVDHRYLFEDVPTGLVPLASLAAALGIPVPITNLVIDLACVTCDVDFRKSGRTLQKLNIAATDPHTLRNLLAG